MTVAAVITKLAEIESGLSGIKHAYDETPEALTVFPCCINYPLRGTITGGPAGVRTGIHVVVCEFHLSRQILPQAEAMARPYIDSFANAIWSDPRLGGVVDTVLELRYEYGRLTFAGEEHLGLRWEVEFKLQEVNA